ncbi:MAG: hypothetical protein J7K88_06300, partial [Candidatus Fermentibacteraceae bacterium]|nr:hypothetical protein [Candidatus Fermentibacteraceae bacterium]
MAGSIVLLMAALAVILPDAVDVPGVNAGETVESARSGGYQWVRILENDYAVIEVTSSPAVPMTAYDNTGEVLSFSIDGEPLMLSAYSDYWFWIKADSPTPVDFTVSYCQPEPVDTRGVSSSLSSAEMAEIWTFQAEEDGRWN